MDEFKADTFLGQKKTDEDLLTELREISAKELKLDSKSISNEVAKEIMINHLIMEILSVDEKFDLLRMAKLMKVIVKKLKSFKENTPNSVPFIHVSVTTDPRTRGKKKSDETLLEIQQILKPIDFVTPNIFDVLRIEAPVDLLREHNSIVSEIVEVEKCMSSTVPNKKLIDKVVEVKKSMAKNKRVIKKKMKESINHRFETVDCENVIFEVVDTVDESSQSYVYEKTISRMKETIQSLEVRLEKEMKRTRTWNEEIIRHDLIIIRNWVFGNCRKSSVKELLIKMLNVVISECKSIKERRESLIKSNSLDLFVHKLEGSMKIGEFMDYIDELRKEECDFDRFNQRSENYSRITTMFNLKEASENEKFKNTDDAD